MPKTKSTVDVCYEVAEDIAQDIEKLLENEIGKRLEMLELYYPQGLATVKLAGIVENHLRKRLTTQRIQAITARVEDIDGDYLIIKIIRR